MSNRKSTIRRTSSAETFPNVEEYNRQRNMLDLPGHHELSVLAENPSYMTTLNDLTEENPLYAPTPKRIKPPSPALTNLLNLPRPGKYTQSNEKYDGEGLPPSLKKSSSKSKKEPSLFEPLRISTGKQPFSSQTQTFTILNPRATRTKLPKKKSKGGKNKTKKRKAKKTKKNKKTKK